MPKGSQKGDKKLSKRVKNDEKEVKDSQKGFKMGSTSVKTGLRRYQRGKKQRKGSLGSPRRLCALGCVNSHTPPPRTEPI